MSDSRQDPLDINIKPAKAKTVEIITAETHPHLYPMGAETHPLLYSEIIRESMQSTMALAAAAAERFNETNRESFSRLAHSLAATLAGLPSTATDLEIANAQMRQAAKMLESLRLPSFTSFSEIISSSQFGLLYGLPTAVETPAPRKTETPDTTVDQAPAVVEAPGKAPATEVDDWFDDLETTDGKRQPYAHAITIMFVLMKGEALSHYEAAAIIGKHRTTASRLFGQVAELARLYGYRLAEVPGTWPLKYRLVKF